MKTTRLTRMAIFVVFVFMSASSPSAELSELDWVLGKWQINESNSFEEWVKVNDDLYQGKSYQVRETGTVLSETIEITRRGKEVFYTPTVMDQNDGKPVDFKLVSLSDNEFVFENKEHDFPQRIIYVKNGDCQIDARIEGQRNGQFSKVNFQLNQID